MDDPSVLLPLLSLIAIGVVLFLLTEKRAKARKTEGLFAGREKLDERQFHERYFRAQGIPFHVVSGVRRIMEECLEADLSRLADRDDFSKELKFFWHYDSMADEMMVIELEKEFDIEIPDDEVKKIRTVNDIVETVWEKVRGKSA